MTQDEAMAETAKRKVPGGALPCTGYFPPESRYIVSCGDFQGSGANWDEAVAVAIQREAQNV